MSKRGLFITIEGSEGAGKSTASAFIRDALQNAGIDLVCTREPGGTVLGERLRDVLLTPTDSPISPLAELLMMFAARAQHIEEVITPAINSGQWVLCDRFTDASYAYQGGGRSLGDAPVRLLEDLVQASLRPDLTILMDVPVDVGLERARGRGALDRFELEDMAFFNRVRATYLRKARSGSGRYRVVDAARELPDVQAELAEIARELVACPPLLEN